MQNLAHLHLLLASAHTAEALEQLTAWAQTQSPVWRQAALLLQASWASNEQQANRGLIAYEEAERTRNRIMAGALGLLEEIENGASAPKAVLEGLQKQFLNEQVATVMQGGNVTNLSGSNIQVQGSQDVVIGSGNVITKKRIAGLARGQFLGIAAGLLILVLGGYFAFDLLRDRQEETFVSLQEILTEIKMRSEQDAGVRILVKDNQMNLERWLNTGMNALKRKQYPIAVENLEKVAAEVPLATVRQNLAFAYQQMGNAGKAKENLEQAQQIRKMAPPAEKTTPPSPKDQPVVEQKVPEAAPKTNTAGEKSIPSGQSINLFAPENGGKFITGTDPRMEKLIDGREKRFFFKNNDEIIVGFNNGHSATFNRFELFIDGSSNHNIAEFELSAANAPDGEFKVIGVFQTKNELVSNSPYQSFSFSPLTAKYLKFKIIKHVGDFTWDPHAAEIKLFGFF